MWGRCVDSGSLKGMRGAVGGGGTGKLHFHPPLSCDVRKNHTERQSTHTHTRTTAAGNSGEVVGV